MKKLVALICIVAILVIPNVSYAYNPITKGVRGALNVVTCPFEIVEQVKETTKDKGIAVGYTVGIVKGIGKTFARGLVGIYEVLTFPLPFPNGFGPIITDPDSILDWEW